MTGLTGVLAVILAREGSKGLPGKNTMSLLGKPLVAWSIEAGLGASQVDDVVVSTDSPEIAAIARNFGAQVPFMRPAELATDFTSSIDALLHALNAMEELGKTYKYVVLLEPTSPMRGSSDIDEALKTLIAQDGCSIVSVCRAETVHPNFIYSWSDGGNLVPFVNSQPNNLRRQDVTELYYLEGSIYASKIETLREKRSFYHEGTMGYLIPKWKSPEIDDEVDFLQVEAIMRHKGLFE